jgi:lactate dehydrogenase-like 2-hydroxyacid dehydrogenase
VPSTRPIVVVTRRLPEAVELALRERFDARLSPDDHPMTAAELAEALRTADALLPTVTDAIGSDVLAAAQPRARILANFGVGVNHIDLEAAGAHGIVVTNTPDVLTDDTADLAIALMLMVARRLGEGERELRAGRWTGWRPTDHMGRTLHGLRLGIIGYGRIGRAVAARARQAFGMRVRFVGSGSGTTPPADEHAQPAASLEALLAESDVLSLHCPLTPETHHLMNAERLAMMPPGAMLINTARGPVVDEAALAEALRSGRLFGAGLDVYEREPAVPRELLAMEQVVLLPHLGSATVETRTAMGMRAVENLTAFFEGRAPPDRAA